MKALKKIGFFVLALMALFLIIPLFTSKEYTVERSITINADKSTVYNYMLDFENFRDWSPWAEKDPQMEVKISKKEGGVGSVYHWKGNDDVGEGSMTITSASAEKIDIQLAFIKPFEAQSPTSYKFEETANGTKVSWYMEGNMDYPSNFFLLFMNMEEAIGKDFDQGLEKLKGNLEAN